MGRRALSASALVAIFIQFSLTLYVLYKYVLLFGISIVYMGEGALTLFPSRFIISWNFTNSTKQHLQTAISTLLLNTSFPSLCTSRLDISPALFHQTTPISQDDDRSQKRFPLQTRVKDTTQAKLPEDTNINNK